MPNIIEQQDLLKGLTDQRLSMLMQQPTGDIPPFLVAAEAQRRQAIRAQFGGDPQANESVVDTLAKQMAGVPQDVNPNPAAPAAPPQMAQPDAGIAGLDQGMARGGMVRRYGNGGSVFTGRYGAQTSDPNARPWGVIGGVFDYVGSGLNSLSQGVSNAVSNAQKYGINPNTPDRAKFDAENKAQAAIDDVEAEAYVDPFIAGAKFGKASNKLVKPRNPTNGQKGTSAVNQDKPIEDEIRQRLEALYSDDGVSSWDRAQKWFNVSQGLLDPDATTGELIANAIGTFGQGMAEENRMRKQAERDREEALLKYDIGVAQDEEASAAAGVKAKTDIATGQLDDLYRQMSSAQRDLEAVQSDLDKGQYPDPAAGEARKKEIADTMTAIGARIAMYEKYLQSQYGFKAIPVVDSAAGTVK